MPHPFFDAIEFPWHLDEAKAFRKSLSTAFKAPARIDLLYSDCGPGLPPLFLGHGAELVWKEAIDNLAQAGLIRKLVDNLLTLPNTDVVEKARQIAAAVSVLESTVLGSASGPRFLDRKQLRAVAEEMGEPSNPIKVLVVRGEGNSGRTWTRWLIESIARERNEMALYYCEGLVGDVASLIDDLFDRFDAAALRPAGSPGVDSWYKTVCSKLALAATKAKTCCWLVVDNLDDGSDGSPRMDPQIRRFLEQFAFAMVTPAFRERFRLVLIAYPGGPTPTTWQSEHFRVEETAIADIKTPHVITHLDEWAGRKGRVLPADERTGIATRVIANADAAPPGERLLVLKQKLDEEIDKLGGVA